MVEAMDAQRSLVAFGLPISAKISVLIYQDQKDSAGSCKNTFDFFSICIFHSNHPLHLSETLVYYIKSREKMQMNTKEYDKNE